MRLSCFGSCIYEEVHRGSCGLEVGPSCEVDRIRGGRLHLPSNAPLTLSSRILPYKSSPLFRRSVQIMQNVIRSIAMSSVMWVADCAVPVNTVID